MMFRAATGADTGALHSLIERAYRGDSARGGWTHEADLLGGQRTDPAALATQLSSPDDLIIVAEAEGQPIGCIALTDRGGGIVYIGLVTVDPHLQGAGLGRALLDKGERAAAERFGATRTVMTVIEQRTELVAWYERRGYRLTGEHRPFPYGDERFGTPKTHALVFAVLDKLLDGTISSRNTD